MLTPLTPPAEINIAPLPPPIRIASTTQFPGWTPSPNNTPAPAPVKTVKPFPLVPGEIWNTTRVVVWQLDNPRCAFWRGALALGLRHTERNGRLFVKTSLEELALLIVWSWDNK